jgi:hypothetical protein
LPRQKPHASAAWRETAAVGRTRLVLPRWAQLLLLLLLLLRWAQLLV